MAKGSIEGVFLPSSGDCDRIFKIAKSEHRRSAHEPLEHQARASLDAPEEDDAVAMEVEGQDDPTNTNISDAAVTNAEA